MKKILCGLLVICAAGIGFAQTDIFFPSQAITFGQGGAYTADAEGMNSFFYNPAGFARGSEFSISANAYASAHRSLWRFLDKQFLGNTGIFGTSSKGISSASRQSFGDGDFEGILGEFGVTDALYEQVDIVFGAIMEADFNSSEDYSTGPGAFFSDLLNNPNVSNALSNAGLPSSKIDALIEDLGNLESDNIQEALGTIISEVAPVLSQAEVITSILDTAASMYADEFNNGNPPKKDDKTYDKDVVAAEAKKMEENFPSGNMRVGGLLAVAYSGHGLGFGLFANVDGTFNGANILATKGRAFTTLTFAAGFAFPLGPVTLGAQVRPTLLGYANVDPSSMISSLMGGEAAEFGITSVLNDGIYTGFRIGVDIGALLDLGPFSFGVAVKDIIPFQLQEVTKYDADELVDQISGGEFPLGTGSTDFDQSKLYQVPPLKVNVGASFHPDLGAFSKIIDPKINVDIHDLFGFLRDKDDIINEKASILNYLNAGAEVKFLQFISARAGWNGGFDGGALTAGLGLRLLFLDINAGIAASNPQTINGNFSFGNLGLSAEVAIRL